MAATRERDDDGELLRTAWYGRAVLAAGAALTLSTGIGLWGWPESAGPDFAWEIGAPLTAAWMGAWYTGASVALVLGVRERIWSRARIVFVIALTLTTASLVATVRFSGAFRLGEGSSLQRAIAWTWLAVYVALPLAVLLVLLVHERAGGSSETTTDAPQLRLTRAVLAAASVASIGLGLWLTLAPSRLIDAWPWPINDLSASILGAWALTVGVGCAWALREGDWRRTRILLGPFQAALVLLLVAAARHGDAFTGGDRSIAISIAVLVAALVAFTVVGMAQRRDGRRATASSTAP